MTPGYKTTDFWKAILCQVLTLLVVSGVVSPADGDTLAGAASNALTAAVALVANAVVIVQYIKGRVQLKQPPAADAPKSA